MTLCLQQLRIKLFHCSLSISLFLSIVTCMITMSSSIRSTWKIDTLISSNNDITLGKAYSLSNSISIKSSYSYAKCLISIVDQLAWFFCKIWIRIVHHLILKSISNSHCPDFHNSFVIILVFISSRLINSYFEVKFCVLRQFITHSLKQTQINDISIMLHLTIT